MTKDPTHSVPPTAKRPTSSLRNGGIRTPRFTDRLPCSPICRQISQRRTLK